MSRPRKLMEKYNLTLDLDQTALVEYYAWKYKRDKVDIVRQIVGRYGLADKSLDEKDFQKFTEQQLEPEYSDDEPMRKELQRKVKDFLDSRSQVMKGKK